MFVCLCTSCTQPPVITEPSAGLPIADYKKMILAEPDNSKLYYNLGTEYVLDGRYRLAVKELKKAIQIDYKDPQAYNNLGYAYYRLKEFEQARKTFYKGIMLDNKSGILYYNLGLAEFQNGRYLESVKHLRLAKHYDANLTERVNDLMLVVPLPGT